jgi:thiol-disulfide isomerase/thioredoxin
MFRHAAIPVVVVSTLMVLAAGPKVAVLAQGAQPGAAKPDAQQVLRQMGAYLKGLDRYTFEFTALRRTTGEGIRMEYESSFAVAVSRPDKAAIRFLRGAPSVTVVSDGHKRYTLLTSPNKYKEDDASKSIAEALVTGDDQPWTQFFYEPLKVPGLRTLLSDDPAQVLAPLVDSAQYIGLEQADGVPAHHLRLSSGVQRIDVWIAAGDRPFPVRGEAEQPSQADPTGMWKGTKLDYTMIVRNWETPALLPDDRFAFTPPPHAERVDDLAQALMASGGGKGDEPDQPKADLVGQKAPNFELALLDGGTVSPAKLAEQGKVVVLDFWATWCPPCRQGLPIVAEVMKAYAPEQAVFLAVNLQEPAATIRTFLQSTKLDFRVALDKDGKVAAKYGADAIPQTVIIGKDGTVQAVHVGLLPDLRERLKEEVDAVLAGKNLAEEHAAPVEAENLETAWSLHGRWSGVAVDEASGTIYALGPGQLAVLGSDGKIIRQVKVSAQATSLRLARLQEGGEPGFVAFSRWGGGSVEAFDAGGKRLWSHTGGQGIDDVWAADLNGDGVDEVIIGYNGSTGLHVVKPGGELLWKYTGLANVWHVTAADLAGDGSMEVITTSAEGVVHVFDRDGKKLKDLSPGLYADMVRVAPPAAGKGTVILAGGESSVACLDPGGTRRWITKLPGAELVVEMAIAPGRPWAAIAGPTGTFVLDVTTGQVLARGKYGANASGVAWVKTTGEDSSPLLLVATGEGVTALRVTGKK